MGRKQGGSLFHQLGKAAGIMDDSGKIITGGHSYRTSRNYANWLHRAADYFKSKGITRADQIHRAEIQAYSDALQASGKYSPSTVHNYLAALCRAAEVPLSSISKPIRAASGFSRGSGGGSGKAYELNELVGLRRSELGQLRKEDLTVDGNGNMYVMVHRGKGGKSQKQYILPENQESVRQFFGAVGAGEKVLANDDFNGTSDYHAQRRKNAQKAYEYFSQRISEGGEEYRKELYSELAGRAHAENKKNRSIEPYSHFDSPYTLRGANRAKAEAEGKPTEYNRLAVRAVSILCLAHWRDNVTVEDYLLR